MSNPMTSELHSEIDRQIYLLHRTRSVFPRLGQELVGQKQFDSPDYYKQLGFNATFDVAEGISQEFVDGFFEIGHWINENFLLRVWAVLESHKIVGNTVKIDKTLDGWENVELLRRLRNKVGHGSGLYDPEDPDKKMLWDMIVGHYKLQPGYSYLEVDKYPIGVKQVLVPMAEGCKKYVTAFVEKNHAGNAAGTSQKP